MRNGLIKSRLDCITKVVAIFAFIVMSLSATAATPQEVLKRAASRVMTGAGTTCSYKATYGGRTVSGTMKVSGSKFVNITNGYGSTWYDGKSMWVYNPASKETTLMKPTASEILESNPMNYIGGYDKLFNLKMSPKKVKGKEVVIMTAKSKSAPAKQVIVTVNGTSYAPERLDITLQDNQKSTVVLTGLRSGQKLSASEFVYPKQRYAGVPVVDLR